MKIVSIEFNKRLFDINVVIPACLLCCIFELYEQMLLYCVYLLCETDSNEIIRDYHSLS